MKKFLVVMAVNMVLLLLILECLSYYILSSKNYFSKKLSWYWLRECEKELQTQIGSDTLVLGCSVANQLFNQNAKRNFKITSSVDLIVTSNILVNKCIENNPKLKTIVVIAIPRSFAQIFWSECTYNQFIKPFYTFSNFKYFNWYLHRQIAKRPLALLSAFSFFKILPISDFTYQDNNAYDLNNLSTLTILYLTRMKNLTASHKIKLVLIASPVSDKFMRETNNCESLKLSIRKNGFGDMFKGYFENILIYPDSCFIDGTHFKQEFLKKHREEIISRIRL